MFVSGFVLVGLGLYAAFVGSIWFLTKAFSTHVGWGLLSLLVPPVALVFAIKHWGISWRPLALNIAGSVGAVGGGALLAISFANEASIDFSQSLNGWNPTSQPFGPPVPVPVTAEPAETTAAP